MLNIGILGYGRIGQVHAMTIGRLAAVRLTAVADAFPAAALSLAGQTGAQVMDAQALIDNTVNFHAKVRRIFHREVATSKVCSAGYAGVQTLLGSFLFWLQRPSLP